MSREAPLYTEAEIRALLEREEGQFFELKSLWDRESSTPRPLDRRKARDLVAEAVAAFANADGGVLLVGVDPDGSLSGHGYPEEAVAELLAVPERRLQPAASCRTQRICIDGHEILVFEVEIAPEAVMFVGDGFPYRVGVRVVREPQEVINARKEVYRRVGYERRIRAEATLDDLDQELARRLLAATPLGQRPLDEILQRFGLVEPRARSFGVTNAALLLFGKTPLVRWHPRAGVRFFRVAGTEREHGTNRNVTQLDRIELPIADAIPAALKFASTQIHRSEKLHDLFFRETPEYPEFAWQEALVNAVAHRDYEVQGQEIEVWFFSDRMEVKSPGDLVPPVTLETLRARQLVHASRNPLIVRVLVEAGVMREEGEGIPRMFDEMQRSFLHPPRLTVEHSVFQVALFNEPIFVGPSVEWQSMVAGWPITAAQKRVLLGHPQGFSNEDYRRLNEVDRDAAYREIQDLVAKGIVVSTGAAGRGMIYRIAPDIHQARVFLEARLPRLREFFGRTEKLTNAAYRELFSVNRSEARAELRRLVEEGLLRMAGERRGAHYRPEPALRVGDTRGAT